MKKLFLLLCLVLLVACQPKTVYVKVEEKALNETMDMLQYCSEKVTAYRGFWECNDELLGISAEYIANDNAFYDCLAKHTSEYCIHQLTTLQIPVTERVVAKNEECAEHIKKLVELKEVKK